MNLFINSIELAEECGISQREASQIIREVQKDLESRGYYVMKCKPLKAPRKEVFKKLGVEI